MVEKTETGNNQSLYDKICRSKYLYNYFSLPFGIMLWINGVSIAITSTINQHIISDEKTVVFTGGYDPAPIPPEIISITIDYFMYTPITLRQNMDGSHVDWYSNATQEEVLKNLLKPEYQNIVFIGHGDSSTFAVSDGAVTSYDIMDWHIPTKKGKLIQHTCGKETYDPSLREVLLQSPREQWYGFEDTVSGGINYFTAWKRVFMGYENK